MAPLLVQRWHPTWWPGLPGSRLRAGALAPSLLVLVGEAVGEEERGGSHGSRRSWTW